MNCVLSFVLYCIVLYCDVLYCIVFIVLYSIKCVCCRNVVHCSSWRRLVGSVFWHFVVTVLTAYRAMMDREVLQELNVDRHGTWIRKGWQTMQLTRSLVTSTATSKFAARSADKSLVRPGRKKANVSVTVVRFSFVAFSCRKKKTWWQLASRCCWNRVRPWHVPELVSFHILLQHIPTRGYNITQSSAPDDGHMVA